MSKRIWLYVIECAGLHLVKKRCPCKRNYDNHDITRLMPHPIKRMKLWNKSLSRARSYKNKQTYREPYPMVSHLSPPQRHLCVAGRLPRKKNRACLFPLPIAPRALSIFSDYCYFYRDTEREPLRRREVSHDVRRPYWCSKQMLWELNSFGT